MTCPCCDHCINLNSPKPGRYQPRCPKCARLFVLLVADDGVCDARPASNDTHGRKNDVRAVSSRIAALKPGGPREFEAPEPVPAGAPADSGLLELAKTTRNMKGVPHHPASGPAASAHQVAVGQGKPGETVEVDDEGFVAPKTEIRGYRIERELGRGGMGAVFLAQQLSLDRPVALKVMARRWANDPTFVARFTREAYAAAQLSHPNIVQIHDIGEVDGARFFSMEYVRGRSLADLVKDEGKLDPETAVGYVLQAARGLKHAHDRGMIHRDVKPDNLLLDDQGLVKVADLGLVKTPVTSPSDDTLSGSSSGLHTLPINMTGVRIALGTPAYMSPEQCRDAASVDHRADIYSLGCTLYVLVTGRPPFDGTTAVELMTKQAYEPIVPPERIVARLPAEISAIIQRMMAKGAHERFQNMGEVIRTLEGWLGVYHTGTFSPTEEQIGKLESYVLAYDTAPSAVLRNRLLTGFLSTTVLLVILLLFFDRLGWAFGLVGLVIQSSLAYFVLNGITRKGPLFTRVRQFVFGLGLGDWGIAAACFVLFNLLLWMSGTLWIWVGFGLVGAGLAVGLRFWLDRQADDERQAPLSACERFLRRLRAKGLGEEELRLFVAKFSGRHWEEFFEALFGYEVKLAARTLLSLRGGAAGPREKFAAWREPILGAIDRIETSRKAARERKLLQAVEHARLIAEGHARDEAERKAQVTAEAMIHQASRVRDGEVEMAKVGPASHSAYTPPTNARRPAGGVGNPDLALEARRPDRLSRLVGLFVGPPVRAALAATLLAGCGLWARQNGMLPGAEMPTRAVAAAEVKAPSELETAAAQHVNQRTTPLQVEGVPTPLTAWVDSFNVGVAGLLLLGSLFFRGNVMSVLVLVGAGVAVTGHQFGIRAAEPFRDYHVALFLGSVLALIGYRAGTR